MSRSGKWDKRPGLLLVALMAINLSACSREEVKTEFVEAPVVLPAPEGEALAALEAADAADGAKDKLVKKCISCRLNMDGHAEHTVSLGGYEVHFCSHHCLKSFVEEPAKALLALR